MGMLPLPADGPQNPFGRGDTKMDLGSEDLHCVATLCTLLVGALRGGKLFLKAVDVVDDGDVATDVALDGGHGCQVGGRELQRHGESCKSGEQAGRWSTKKTGIVRGDYFLTLAPHLLADNAGIDQLSRS